MGVKAKRRRPKAENVNEHRTATRQQRPTAHHDEHEGREEHEEGPL
jgi:hypothetical protein